MTIYFHRISKILVAIFHYFFQEDTTEPKRTAFERLISASISDSMEYFKRQFGIEIDGYGSEVITEQAIPQQKDQIPRSVPLVPDIKKQFKIWSDNMRDYDAIRKRLMDSA